MKVFCVFFFTFFTLYSRHQLYQKSKQVVIHCCGGSGWGDYSASLFVAMKFREIGFRVYLVMDLLFQNYSSMNKRIDDFFQIFEPAFSSLYKLTRADVFFYTTKSLNDDYESCWKRRLFSFNQLIEFLPIPFERPDWFVLNVLVSKTNNEINIPIVLMLRSLNFMRILFIEP